LATKIWIIYNHLKYVGLVTKILNHIYSCLVDCISDLGEFYYIVCEHKNSFWSNFVTFHFFETLVDSYVGKCIASCGPFALGCNAAWVWFWVHICMCVFMWFGGLNVEANDFEICFKLDSCIKLFCAFSSSLEQQTKP
jgi:hypothetical protein